MKNCADCGHIEEGFCPHCPLPLPHNALVEGCIKTHCTTASSPPNEQMGAIRADHFPKPGTKFHTMLPTSLPTDVFLDSFFSLQYMGLISYHTVIKWESVCEPFVTF